jgi:RNA polymerase sigma factor (TIGR02999 family)
MFHEAPGNTLQTTGLVNEAYLRLCRGEDANWENRRHFFGAAAIAMRRILIDRARRQKARKHGGDLEQVTLGDDLAGPERPCELIALDAALKRLAKDRPRAAEVVSYRFFLGLTVKQTAELLDVAPKTVDNDWALAKAWLRREIDRQSDAPSTPSE